jgi:hypothetical protein
MNIFGSRTEIVHAKNATELRGKIIDEARECTIKGDKVGIPHIVKRIKKYEYLVITHIYEKGGRE